MKFKETVLEYLQNHDGKPPKLEELAAALKLSDKDLSAFTKELTQLESEGELILTKKGRVALPERLGMVRGIYQGTGKGYGFVNTGKEDEGDVFIPARYTGGAMHTDTVLVKIHTAPYGDKSADGEVVRIVSRNVKEITGTLHRSREGFYVRPDNLRYGDEIRLVRSKSVGTAKAGPARENDKVLVTITSYPGDRTPAAGRVKQSFGQADTLRANYRSVLYSRDIQMEFPEQVAEQARKLFQQGVRPDEGRLDLRQEQIFTIDGADAKDFDDAVSLTYNPEGNPVLGVHIADVSHYVTENSPLDAEALSRGTSIYFTDQVVPMLPYELSNELCSLKPDEDRQAFSVFMELDASANVISYTLHKSVIRSCCRGVYSEINAVLAGEASDEEKAKYKKILKTLKKMQTIAKKRYKLRVARGSLDLDTPESKVIIGDNDTPVDVVRRERGVTERLIEEFMLMCNETVAQHAMEHDLPFVYRVHDKPDMERSGDFLKLSAALGYPVKTTRDGVSPQAMQDVLNRVKGTPLQRIISTILLRSLMKAEYSAACAGHFGLAARYYCHFTSPIRRYPDLMIHRILSEELRGMTARRRNALSGRVADIARQSSEREIIAMDAERDIEQLYKTQYMADHVGERFEGVISSVTSFGFFVELQNTIEGLVRLADLADDYYVFDEASLVLTGRRTGKRYTIGDQVDVTLVRADITSRQIDFVLTERAKELEL